MLDQVEARLGNARERGDAGIGVPRPPPPGQGDGARRAHRRRRWHGARDALAAAGPEPDPSAGLYPAKRNERYTLDRPITDEKLSDPLQ